jgi:hypothetical protein
MIQLSVNSVPVETLISFSGTSRTSAPPVIRWAQPSAAPRLPRVVIRAGTRRRVMHSPLNSPQPQPPPSATSRPTTTVHALSVPIHSIALAESTPEKTSTEPIERSNPPATITNVIPVAITISVETSMRMLRAL